MVCCNVRFGRRTHCCRRHAMLLLFVRRCVSQLRAPALKKKSVETKLGLVFQTCRGSPVFVPIAEETLSAFPSGLEK